MSAPQIQHNESRATLTYWAASVMVYAVLAGAAFHVNAQALGWAFLILSMLFVHFLLFPSTQPDPVKVRNDDRR